MSRFAGVMWLMLGLSGGFFWAL